MTVARRSATLIALALTLLSLRASAAQPVIEQGRERDVLALLAPYTLGKPVAEGYVLWDVAIEATHVTISVRAASGEVSRVLRLAHPTSASSGAETSKSFALLRLPAGRDGPARAAADALVSAVKRNDAGGFWRALRDLPAAGEGQLVSFGLYAWLTDGIVLWLFVAALAIGLAARSLAPEPRWMAAALAVVVLAAAVLRALLSPELGLGAWPYSRLYPHARLVFFGPALATLSNTLDRPFLLTQVISASTFAYATVAPIALFAAAARVLDDRRAALAAATVLAFLPQHVRFSAAEDGALPSVTFAALTLALVMIALESRSVRAICAALFALGPLLLVLFELRPLNALHALVLGLAPFVIVTSAAQRRRIALGSLLAVVGLCALVVQARREPVLDSTQGRSEILSAALRGLTEPLLPAPLDPGVTPLFVMAIATAGGVALWRAKRRPLIAWLGGWMLLIVAAHSVVGEASMQPRYHLPVVLPLALLAGAGVSALFAWRRLAGSAALVAAVLSPVTHATFIRDVDYGDLLEQDFVRRAGALVPAGCRIVEFAGSHAEESRFRRTGTRLSNGAISNFWDVLPVVARAGAGPLDPAIESALTTPERCTFVYEGLPCHGDKQPEQTSAPVCARLAELAPLEVVSTAELPVRAYNGAALSGVARDARQLRLTLYEVKSK